MDGFLVIAVVFLPLVVLPLALAIRGAPDPERAAGSEAASARSVTRHLPWVVVAGGMVVVAMALVRGLPLVVPVGVTACGLVGAWAVRTSTTDARHRGGR